MSSSDDSEQTKLEVQLEISNFQRDFPNCPYKMIEKIGQGTFSSVYKAVDTQHQHTSDCGEECNIVAVKRIYPTSSPTRILTELSILHSLSGHPNIAPLLNAIRHDDQVIAVLPYYPHANFKHYFRELSNNQTKSYLRSLLSALKHVHHKGYIHRDVKPSNFIFSPEKEAGVLIDFGLAQTEADKRDDSKFKQPKPIKLEKRRPFYIVDDKRPSIRANRAGTRGFRAPEVLFKVIHQTRAIDIWSVGVILLSILTGQFPFFQSTDDVEAMLEISHIFGKQKMKQLACTLRKEIGLRHIVDKMSENPVDEEALDLLEKLLELDPSKRITASEALHHTYLQQ